MKIRPGSHPNNLSLFILRHRGVLETAARAHHWQIEWFDYAAGAQSADYLWDNQVDVVGTGSTPPIRAVADGHDVTYLASSPPRDNNSALLMHQDRPLVSLRGARIAAMIGSFTDHFLARLLHQQQLHRADVTLLDLQGQTALDALLAGNIDGWLAIDPWLTRARTVPAVVEAARVGDEIINRSLFWTRSEWQQQHPQAASWLVQQLEENDRWIEQHPQHAACILSEHLNNAITPEEWQQTLRGRPWGIVPVSDALITEQQQQADDLFAAGFIPAAIEISHRR